MSGVSSFNSLLEQFINELKECFPDENKLKVYFNSFEILKKSNPKKCMTAFMSAIEPYKERINQEDETLMIDESISLVNDLNLCGIWKHENCTDNTKQAIWSHLKTLIIFGSTLQVIPSGLMSGIEKLASEYADQMDATDMNEIDTSMLMQNMQKMLSKS
tara:strand:- start:1236 stop:1715 length:480 start_codon:yes stop_codon:yes gene_type:complete